MSRVLFRVTPDELRRLALPAGSMGPKAEAACRFAAATGHPAVIGDIDDAALLLAGGAGTTVKPWREGPSACRGGADAPAGRGPLPVPRAAVSR